MSQPVVFDVPADVDLEPDPIRPGWVIEGTPQVSSKCVAGSADGASSVMVWSCTAGRFVWCYKVDEMLHVLSGEAFVTNEDGTDRRLGPGDMAFFPSGARSIWHVPKEVRKLAMCRHTLPGPFGIVLRAWTNLIDLMTGFSSVKVSDAREGKCGAAEELASA
jgi:uncharacterized protein